MNLKIWDSLRDNCTQTSANLLNEPMKQIHHFPMPSLTLKNTSSHFVERIAIKLGAVKLFLTKMAW